MLHLPDITLKRKLNVWIKILCTIWSTKFFLIRIIILDSIFTENSCSNSIIQLIILLVQRTYIWQYMTMTLLLLQLSCCILNYLTCTYISWKGCAQISFVKENILYMPIRYPNKIWKLVKILLSLIFFTKWILIIMLYSNFDFTSSFNHKIGSKLIKSSIFKRIATLSLFCD